MLSVDNVAFEASESGRKCNEIYYPFQVPQDASSLRSNIYFCSSCNQYLPSTDFFMSSNSDTVGRCKRCLKMDNDSRVRQDYSHYRYMLKALRRSEENYGDDSKIAFLLQVLTTLFTLSTFTTTGWPHSGLH